MRVTHQMMIDRTVFNLSSAVGRLMNVEGMLSSGRRINLPSDDPIGTQHSLAYRTRLAEIEQYKSNINSGLSRLKTYETNFSDLHQFYSEAKQIALAMASSDSEAAGDVSWEAEQAQIDGLVAQIHQIGNSQIDGRYIYSGQRIRTESLLKGANGMVYQGDENNVALELEKSSRVPGTLLGSNVFFKQLQTLGADSDLELGLELDTSIDELNLGDGVDITSGAQPGVFEIFDNNLGITHTVNLNNDEFNNPAAPPATVDEILTRMNGQLGLQGANISFDLSTHGSTLKIIPVTPTTNSVNDNTSLRNLNEGAGIDQDPGIFIITDISGTVELEVDISSASTLGDVRTIMQNALDSEFGAGVVTVGYNADGNGLEITDTTGGMLDLRIENRPNSGDSTATNLGIAGQISPTMTGLDLKPRSDFDIRDIGDQTTASDLGLEGQVLNERSGGALRPILTVDSRLESLKSKLGIDLNIITITQGDDMATVDLSPTSLPANATVQDILDAINDCGLMVNASINDAGTGIQIEHAAGAPAQSLIVENFDKSDTTARDLGIEGSPDMVGSLILLSNSMERRDRVLVEKLLGNMDEAMEYLLGTRAEIGTRMIRMETTLNRHEETELNVRGLLSETEDADIISLVSDLARQENLYQAALMASSKVIQPSLLDFL